MGTSRGGRYAHSKRYDIPDLGITVRSRDEVRIAGQIKAVEGAVAYESDKLPYVVPSKPKWYHPDFRLKNGIYVEYKGEFTAADRAKHLYVREQNPAADVRFVFTNPDRAIYKGSKTTYASWCRDNGFRYARKYIPEAWFREKGTA